MTVNAEWDFSNNICQCQGTGCYLCGHTGEVPGNPTLLYVDCPCGWQCDGRQFKEHMERTDGRCPDCGCALAEAVAETEPDCVLDLDGFREPYDD